MSTYVSVTLDGGGCPVTNLAELVFFNLPLALVLGCYPAHPMLTVPYPFGPMITQAYWQHEAQAGITTNSYLGSQISKDLQWLFNMVLICGLH